ncbi:MAG TPA: hypothetical protein VMJ10_04805 [Kofleriaceae bacterium]|nr:hypothetical protein [Kofleriaceae bacterium]
MLNTALWIGEGVVALAVLLAGFTKLTGIALMLTPFAAVCSGVLMIGAVRTHRRLGEGVAPAVVIAALCIAIAAGRAAARAASHPAAVASTAAVQQ